MKKELLIISDSPMYVSNGIIYAFEPTLIEIEELTKLFDVVVWIGFEKSGYIEANFRPAKADGVKLQLLPNASGGEYWYQKLSILFYLPFLFLKILNAIRGFSYVHTRGPSVPALIGILYSFMDHKRKYWHKYAGNWAQTNPPSSYAIQRFLLRKLNRHSITVNGKWRNEKPNVLTFENPCLFESHRSIGANLILKRGFNPPFTFCFAGRLETPKGVSRIIDLISDRSIEHLFKCVHFIGDGSEREVFEERCKSLSIKCFFHGFLSKEETFSKLKESDFLLLPTTASEGFPKVIAEAANFGCIPIVSNISSIGQYVNDRNGFVWNFKEESFTEFFKRTDFSTEHLREVSKLTYEIGENFTFSRYLKRVKNEVFFLD